MTNRLFSLFTAGMAAFALLTGAAPAPDPLLGRIVADARAIAPAGLAFERLSRIVTQEDGGAAKTSVRVDRWDGRSFALISVDGKAPPAKESEDFRKLAASRPIPGYHRLGDFLKGGATRLADAQGRIIYRVTGLPKGTVNVGKDVSASLTGEFTVDASGAQPYVTRARLILPKPLSFFLVAKLDSLDIVFDYRLDGNGRPYLAHVVQTLSGAQFGKQGSTRTETSYTMLR